MSNPIKQIVARGMGCALRLAGVERFAVTRGASILFMYHRVLPGGAPPDWPLKSLIVDLTDFERQMTWLCRRYEVCTAFDAVCGVSRGGRPRAAVTFDDGYRDNYLFAAPVLDRLGVPGSFFVTTEFIGSRRRLWFDVAALLWHRGRSAGERRSLANRMSELKRMPRAERDEELSKLAEPSDWVSSERDMPMDWADVNDLRRRGHEIGSHSRTHPILTHLSTTELRDEVVGSVETLRDHGVEPRGIAYPNGDCDEAVTAAAAEAGLRYGLCTQEGWHERGADVMRTRRIDVNPARLKRWSRRTEVGLETQCAWCALLGRRA